jgi:hypothetical protein
LEKADFGGQLAAVCASEARSLYHDARWVSANCSFGIVLQDQQVKALLRLIQPITWRD